MPQPAAGQTISTSMSPIAKPRFGYDQARHLLWRAGFGGSPDQIRTLADWGPQRAVEHLLDFSVGDYPEPKESDFEPSIMKPPSEAELREYREAQRRQDENAVARFREEIQRRERADRQQVASMQRWWLKRMIETPRPLQEKLALFWHGHFATSYRTIENSYHMFLQNQLFRAKGAGNFGELLFAIIRDPAMLRYLDNNRNIRGNPNENLAREIMELFSLGEGHYTEDDIKEGARALTGYSYDFNEFVFNKNLHDESAKTIFGKAGNFDGDGFVKLILARRECAEFISAKLYRYFVSDAPLNDGSDRARASQSVVRQMAQTMLKARYDLKPVLSRLFLSEHFYDPAIAASRIKSPVDLLVGAIRSMRTPARDLGLLTDALDRMGQDIFFPPSVKGWEVGRPWINTSTLFVRQNVMNYLLTGRTPVGFDAMANVEKYDPTALLDDLAATDPGAQRDPARVVPYILRFALGGEPSASRLDTIMKFTAEHGGQITPPVLTGALALITAMPEYQLC